MALSATRTRIIRNLLQRGMDGLEGRAYPLGTWDKPQRSTTSGDRIKLTEADGKALVDVGLLHHNTNGPVYYELTPAGIQAAWGLASSSASSWNPRHHWSRWSV